jgi:hypothetical protein
MGYRGAVQWNLDSGRRTVEIKQNVIKAADWLTEDILVGGSDDGHVYIYVCLSIVVDSV